MLKYHSQFLATDGTQFLIRQGGDILAIDRNCSKGGFVKSVEATQQTGFSASAQPHNDKYLTFIDGKVGAIYSDSTSCFFLDFLFTLPFHQHLECFIPFTTENKVEFHYFYFLFLIHI